MYYVKRCIKDVLSAEKMNRSIAVTNHQSSTTFKSAARQTVSVSEYRLRDPSHHPQMVPHLHGQPPRHPATLLRGDQQTDQSAAFLQRARWAAVLPGCDTGGAAVERHHTAGAPA